MMESKYAENKLSQRVQTYQELRSDEIQEIVSKRPGFIERWALFFFMGLIVLLVSATWFIQYPDTIEANATLASFNGPKEIISKKEGRLIKLFVQNDDSVKKGQILGFIEASSSHTDILDLEKRIDSSLLLLNKGFLKEISFLFLKEYENLGELQESYREFSQSVQQYNDYFVNGFFSTKKLFLQKDISSLLKKNVIIDQQKVLSGDDLLLSQESFEAHRFLESEKVISKEDLRNVKEKLLNKKMILPQLEATILSNKDLKREKEREIFELEHDEAKQKNHFRQALQSLKSAVSDWVKNYVISAPVSGKISFIAPVQENRFFTNGRTLGYVIPESSEYYIETYLPQSNFGKIEVGQQIQVRFDAYPYQEFGSIEGRLNYISKIPTDSGFLATIQLVNGLVTNHKKVLHYQNGLSAKLIVVTRDERLLQRFFHNIF